MFTIEIILYYKVMETREIIQYFGIDCHERNKIHILFVFFSVFDFSKKLHDNICEFPRNNTVIRLKPFYRAI